MPNIGKIENPLNFTGAFQHVKNYSALYFVVARWRVFFFFRVLYINIIINICYASSEGILHQKLWHEI